MKKYHLILPAIVALTSVSWAQAVSETVTTTAPAVGTVTTFDPTTGALIVTGKEAPATTYVYKTGTTTIVDEAGNPVAVEVIRSGVPVSVYYTKDGNNMVVSKMVVQRASPVIEETTTTTTTTTP